MAMSLRRVMTCHTRDYHQRELRPRKIIYRAFSRDSVRKNVWRLNVVFFSSGISVKTVPLCKRLTFCGVLRTGRCSHLRQIIKDLLNLNWYLEPVVKHLFYKGRIKDKIVINHFTNCSPYPLYSKMTSCNMTVVVGEMKKNSSNFHICDDCSTWGLFEQIPCRLKVIRLAKRKFLPISKKCRCCVEKTGSV